MPASKPKPPPVRPRQFAPVSGDSTVRQVSQSAQRAADQLRDRDVVVSNLTIGDTTLNHALGRAPQGITVCPTVASAAWAWALKSATATQIVITCVGTTQPNAKIEVY